MDRENEDNHIHGNVDEVWELVDGVLVLREVIWDLRNVEQDDGEEPPEIEDVIGADAIVERAHHFMVPLGGGDRDNAMMDVFLLRRQEQQQEEMPPFFQAGAGDGEANNEAVQPLPNGVLDLEAVQRLPNGVLDLEAIQRLPNGVLDLEAVQRLRRNFANNIAMILREDMEDGDMADEDEDLEEEDADQIWPRNEEQDQNPPIPNGVLDLQAVQPLPNGVLDLQAVQRLRRNFANNIAMILREDMEDGDMADEDEDLEEEDADQIWPRNEEQDQNPPIPNGVLDLQAVQPLPNGVLDLQAVRRNFANNIAMILREDVGDMADEDEDEDEDEDADQIWPRNEEQDQNPGRGV